MISMSTTFREKRAVDARHKPASLVKRRKEKVTDAFVFRSFHNSRGTTSFDREFCFPKPNQNYSSKLRMVHDTIPTRSNRRRTFCLRESIFVHKNYVSCTSADRYLPHSQYSPRLRTKRTYSSVSNRFSVKPTTHLLSIYRHYIIFFFRHERKGRNLPIKDRGSNC